MKVIVLVAALVAAATVATPAGATRECHGFPVCVPVAGPWILAGQTEVQFQLACPKRMVVAGLDAELSERGIDVVFRGALGAPVNPGITTSSAAVFLGRVVRGSGRAPSFRPHIGCVPASGTGQRVPTAYAPPSPQSPLSFDVPVLPGTHRFVGACRTNQHLAAATHAIGFYGAAPPTPALASSVTVTQKIEAGKVFVLVHGAPEIRSIHAIVQVDLVCG